MRIAFLSHFYPPAPSGGAGVYAAALAEALQQAGTSSQVLCVGTWDRGSRYFNGCADETHYNVPVRRLHVNWTRAPKPFDYLFDNPVLAQHIESYLEDTKPDLVHVISCYTLSAQALLTPRRLGIPVVVHLVDMWFLCPRHTLLRKNGALCYGSQGDWDCQSCMLWGTKAYGWAGRLLSEHQQKRLFEWLGQVGPVTQLPGLRGMLGDMRRRRSFALDALLQADVLIAPSKALQHLYETNGIPQGRIEYVPYGHSVGWAKNVKRQSHPSVRFGFLGNVLPSKGVHVLLEAFGSLVHDESAELHIYGYDGGDPVYAESLKQQGIRGVFWHGEYTHLDLPRIFSQIDMLVFPSVWHENNPLVIQEAHAAGCPVICSDVGGSAECVRDQVDGLHFRVGDAEDLARQMKRVLEDSDLPRRLGRNLRPVRTIEDDVAQVSALYRKVLIGVV